MVNVKTARKRLQMRVPASAVCASSENIINAVLDAAPQEVLELLCLFPIVMAGGFIRDTIRGVEPKDIDLYPTSATDLASTYVGVGASLLKQGYTVKENKYYYEWHSHRSPYQIQLIKKAMEPQQLIKQFDFRCCGLAIHYNRTSPGKLSAGHFELHVLEESINDAKDGICVLNPNWNKETASSVFLHAKRLSAKGYKIEPKVLFEIADNIDFFINPTESDAYG